MTDINLDEANLWHVENHGHDITDSVSFHGPPGTGKTTTAAATVGRLLRDHDYSIGDVAWVTYRNSLAQDTLERLAGWDVLDESQLEEPTKGATRYIATAHAVGNRCADIGQEPAEEWQRANFCEDRGMKYWTSEPWEDSAGKLLFQVLDYLANANTDPTDTEALHSCPFYEDLQEHWTGDIVDVWYEWRDYKGQMKIIDFHEMLSRPLEQGASPNRDILVIDEYHDVTGLMHQLFTQWMDDAEIVLVAGDPHQVVNAYDGASPHYFESLDLPTVLLPKSWRCTDEHWRVATSILANAHDPPAVEVGGRGLVNDYNSPRFEYSSDTKEWVTVPGLDNTASPGWIVDEHDGSTLFLTRTQMQADGVAAALEIAGIPYRSQRGLQGWNTEAGQTRRWVYNALQKMQGYSPANFNYDGAAGFDRFSDGQRDPRSEELSPDEASTMLEAAHASTLDITRSEANDRAEDLLDSGGTISLHDFDQWLNRTFWERYTSGSASVDRLNRSIFKNGKRELRAVERALVRNDEPLHPDEIDTWAITIHASKGMEADDVVVYDGISRRILQGMQNSQKTRKNEYRTWYVALTRARKRLHIMRGGFEWTNSIIPDSLQEAADASV
jgi:DNA helicase-2/ATP-dependent DNA helicase PcrA